MRKLLNYFSKFEICLWTISVLTITVTFIIFNKTNYLSLVSSLIGVTALIFNAKGNPIGPFIMIIFSITIPFYHKLAQMPIKGLKSSLNSPFIWTFLGHFQDL